METSAALVFGPFRLDLHNQCLWQGTQRIFLRPKSFAVLLHLVEHHGQMVSKQELLSVVWADVQVTDGVVKGCIREIRKALTENHDSPQFIETDQRRGYRFIGKITEASQNELVMPRFEEIEQETAKARLQQMQENLRRQTKTG